MKHCWMRRLGVLCVTAAVVMTTGCTLKTEDTSAPQTARLVVGFSQMEMTNPWRIAETISIQQTAAEAGAEIVIRDANSDANRQIEDCLELIALPVDYLILAPRVDTGYQQVFDEAAKAGIPVILVDRQTEGVLGKDYVCCITADFTWEGQACARKLAEAFEGRPCRIVELTGTPGSFVAKVRSQAFREFVDQSPNMQIVYSASGDFVRTTAQTTMENILQTNKGAFDAIFAHDDDMGIGAIQALKGAGLIPGRDVLVISIAGQKDALKAIIAGELLASVECNPRLGGYVFEAINALEKGEDCQRLVTYGGMVYDASNAEENFDRAF